MIWDFIGCRPLSVRDRVVSIGDCPYPFCPGGYLSKVWRVHVWRNYNEKTGLHAAKLLTRDFII